MVTKTRCFQQIKLSIHSIPGLYVVLFAGMRIRHFSYRYVDSGLYFVQDENDFINPLLQVGSGSVEKSTGSGGPKNQRIRPDPDPHPCFYLVFETVFSFLLIQTTSHLHHHQSILHDIMVYFENKFPPDSSTLSFCSELGRETG